MTLEERFWSKVDKQGENDCWNWQAQIDLNGRGRFKYNYKPEYASRIAWIITNGEIPHPSLHVLHRCDNGKCVNPKHLYLGNHYANMRDMADRHTRDQRGEKNNHSKLKQEQVDLIREKYKINLDKKALALEYRVSVATIHQIITGQKWAGGVWVDYQKKWKQNYRSKSLKNGADGAT